MNYKNGFFQLNAKQDGTYIKLFPQQEGGEPVQVGEIMDYFDLIKLDDYDLVAVKKAMEKAEGATEIKITSKIIENVDETFSIELSEDELKAVARFYPPCPSGKKLTRDSIMDTLNHDGINYGVLKDNIESFLSNRIYGTDIILAEGKPARQGKSASIIYHFNVSTNTKPTLNEDGTVDFHNLNNISHIASGDELATLEPADFGEDGMTVKGAVIKPLKVKNSILKHGKNIHLSEDGLHMYSDVSGHVTLTDDKVFVSDTYEVLADVDASTGDITYDGNVMVKGNVRTGFTVRATGDVYVNGVVEGANVYAGGQVGLKCGMQGMNRGEIRCGDLITKFIENATVVSEGSIKTDAILHSTVMAKDSIVVEGKRGLIVGGAVKAGSLIQMKNCGSTMGTNTSLEVGIDPMILEEYHTLSKELPEWTKEKKKLEQIIILMKTKIQKGEQISPDKIKLLRVVKPQYEDIRNKIQEGMKRLETIADLIAASNKGKIKVLEVMYSGVKLTIGNESEYIHTKEQHCMFVNEGAEIVSKMI